MCDIQVISGIALLVSGLLSLPEANGPITGSDWQMIVYLAWFSATTHLAGLSTLRGYFIRNRHGRSVRVALMFILVALLVTALVPAGLLR